MFSYRLSFFSIFLRVLAQTVEKKKKNSAQESIPYGVVLLMSEMHTGQTGMHVLFKAIMQVFQQELCAELRVQREDDRTSGSVH